MCVCGGGGGGSRENVNPIVLSSGMTRTKELLLLKVVLAIHVERKKFLLCDMVQYNNHYDIHVICNNVFLLIY